jgi:hypothetical protein
LYRKRLSEGWFSWKLRSSLIEQQCVTNNDFEYFSSKDTENVIKLNYDDLKTNFKTFWKDYHDKKCVGCKNQCKSISDHYLNH